MNPLPPPSNPKAGVPPLQYYSPPLPQSYYTSPLGVPTSGLENSNAVPHYPPSFPLPQGEAIPSYPPQLCPFFFSQPPQQQMLQQPPFFHPSSSLLPSSLDGFPASLVPSYLLSTSSARGPPYRPVGGGGSSGALDGPHPLAAVGDAMLPPHLQTADPVAGVAPFPVYLPMESRPPSEGGGGDGKMRSSSSPPPASASSSSSSSPFPLSLAATSYVSFLADDVLLRMMGQYGVDIVRSAGRLVALSPAVIYHASAMLQRFQVIVQQYFRSQYKKTVESSHEKREKETEKAASTVDDTPATFLPVTVLGHGTPLSAEGTRDRTENGERVEGDTTTISLPVLRYTIPKHLHARLPHSGMRGIADLFAPVDFCLYALLEEHEDLFFLAAACLLLSSKLIDPSTPAAKIISAVMRLSFARQRFALEVIPTLIEGRWEDYKACVVDTEVCVTQVLGFGKVVDTPYKYLLVFFSLLVEDRQVPYTPPSSLSSLATPPSSAVLSPSPLPHFSSRHPSRPHVSYSESYLKWLEQATAMVNDIPRLAPLLRYPAASLAIVAIAESCPEALRPALPTRWTEYFGVRMEEVKTIAEEAKDERARCGSSDERWRCWKQHLTFFPPPYRSAAEENTPSKPVLGGEGGEGSAAMTPTASPPPPPPSAGVVEGTILSSTSPWKDPQGSHGQEPWSGKGGERLAEPKEGGVAPPPSAEGGGGHPDVLSAAEPLVCKELAHNPPSEAAKGEKEEEEEEDILLQMRKRRALEKKQRAEAKHGNSKVPTAASPLLPSSASTTGRGAVRATPAAPSSSTHHTSRGSHPQSAVKRDSRSRSGSDRKKNTNRRRRSRSHSHRKEEKHTSPLRAHRHAYTDRPQHSHHRRRRSDSREHSSERRYRRGGESGGSDHRRRRPEEPSRYREEKKEGKRYHLGRQRHGDRR